MATRVFCDHCGNTVHFPNRLMYGTYSGNDYTLAHGNQHQLAQLQQLQQMQAIQAANQSNKLASSSGLLQQPSGIPVHQYHAPVVIDLCDTCVPIWLDRVRKLTESSNPN